MPHPEHSDITVELSAEQLRELGTETIEALVEIFTDVRRRPAAHQKSIVATGDEPLPAHGTHPTQIVRSIKQRLAAEATLFHPRFLGYIPSTNLEICAFVQALAAALNPNLAGHDGGPSANTLEQTVIRWLAELVEYPTTAGILTSGGSVANFMALAVALNEAAGPRLRKIGLQAISPGSRFIAYASTEVHFSIERALRLLGLGIMSLMTVRTDAQGHMDPAALAAAIKADRAAGRIPFCVVANAGSSHRGVVDPLTSIAEVCETEKVWMHVDGAYGAVARMTSARDRLTGLERAQSVTFDPHKWLGVPYDVGCLLVRDKQTLHRTFGFRAVATSPQWIELGLEESRPFRALKVWAAIKLLGREGYRVLLERCIRLAQTLEHRLRQDPEFEVLSSAELSTLIFRYVPLEGSSAEPSQSGETSLNRLNGQIATRATSTGQAFVQATTVDDRVGLRVCFANFRTRSEDVEILVALVRDIGRLVHAARGEEGVRGPLDELVPGTNVEQRTRTLH